MSLDDELIAIQADIKVSATMLDALLAFEQGRELLAWHCLFLWCEAKDIYFDVLTNRSMKP